MQTNTTALGKELWIIMKYYPLGCLANYLRVNTLQYSQALKILSSIISALEYLHHPYYTVQGKTHSIVAHRDLKTGNVLVENVDGVCVLTDFSLSVTERDLERDAASVKVDAGTKRYLAPEVLMGAINPWVIECFCMADIYSFGLVMWEVLRRIETNGKSCDLCSTV